MTDETSAAADPTVADAARQSFETGIGRRTGGGEQVAGLPAPAGLTATGGRGHVTLDWAPVADAVGYLVHRATSSNGPFEPVDHGGNDVLAVPHPPYVDTSGDRGTEYWYAVAALPEVTRTGVLSAPVAATATSDGAALATLTVDAADVVGPVHRPWRPMIGSEHLSFLVETDEVGGRPIGAELTEALRRMHDELHVETVRAHAILCDDLGVYREVDGRPVHDFSGIDRVYDALLATGLRPVVELSYMPRDLAADPTRTVFAYEAVISPPKDWDRWADLVTALTAHLVDRYGIDEVRDRWSFEVWNEANLDVFWAAPRRSTSACTTSRWPRCARSTSCSWSVDRRRPPRSGWRRWCCTPRRPGRRSTSCRPTRTGARRWTCGRSCRGTGATGCRSGGPSGDRVAALPPGRGQRLRGDVPAGGDGLLDGTARGAVALGGVRPLRGAGPADPVEPRRLRPADGRQPAQAALVVAGTARPARRRPARGDGRR